MTSPSELYQAVIVEHDRAPRNAGPLANATHAATADNPMCGDVVTVRLAIDGGVVHAAAFEGKGCALSRAAASIMTERARDATPDALRALAAEFERFVRAAAADPIPAELGDLAAFAGVRSFKSRRNCATLPFRALIAALDSRT